MPPAVKAAIRTQIGKEVTRGTAVAAMRRLVGVESRFRRIEVFEPFDDVMAGVLARTAKAPVLTSNALEFEFRCPLDFEQIMLPLLSGVKGGVTPTGAGADKTWTFTPSNIADPAPDSYTVEFVESDLTNNAEMEAPYCLTEEIEITGGVERLSELRWRMFGRKVVDSTMTAALAIPSLNHAANRKWAIYFDATWAGLGTTQILAQIYGFRWRCVSGVFPQHYLDGRADLDFSAYHYRQRQIELELDVVSDAAAAGLVQTEEANKSAGTARAVQLKILGGTIGATVYTLKLDGWYYHADDSMEERGTDRDGNLITRVHLVSAYDPTSTNDHQETVINGLAAFP